MLGKLILRRWTKGKALEPIVQDVIWSHPGLDEQVAWAIYGMWTQACHEIMGSNRLSAIKTLGDFREVERRAQQLISADVNLSCQLYEVV
jgi:hypothetical protein